MSDSWESDSTSSMSELEDTSARASTSAHNQGLSKGSKSINSTPLRNGLTTRRYQTQYVRSFVDPHLRAEVKDNLKAGLSVCDFVKSVWNFTPDKIPARNTTTPYTVPSNLLKEYVSASNTTHENGCYTALKDIFDNLLEQLRLPPRPLDGTFVLIGKETVVEGSYESLSPDFVFSTISQAKHAQWPWILLPLEVKRTSFKVRAEHENDISITLDWNVQAASKVPEAVKSSPLVAPGSTSERKTQGSTVDQASCGDSSTNAPNVRRSSRVSQSSRSNQPSTTSSGKRKRISSISSSRKLPRVGPSQISNTSRIAGMTSREFQLVSYLHELFAHGIRSHVSGMYVHDTTISLWYADRMGLVRNDAFDFVTTPQLLLLVVAAIGSADIREYGICPLLKLPKKSTPRRFNTFKGSQLELPSAQDELGVKIEGEVNFRLTKNLPRYTQYGLVGRGTTILDVKAHGSKWKKRFGDQTLIAKLSWPVASRTGEDKFIRAIRQKIPKKYRQNIVSLKCSMSIKRQDFDLPRNHMELGKVGEERIFRMLIMEEYYQLKQVNSVDEFKKVLLDVVHGHHYVYEHAGVLHRDLSINNVMFSRKGYQLIGVLCDWDLAMFVDETNNDSRKAIPGDTSDGQFVDDAHVSNVSVAGVTNLQPRESEDVVGNHEQDANPSEAQVDDNLKPTHKAAHRTGTGPYMAIDLLVSKETPRHLYRHDLESCFFIVTWFCAAFIPEEHTYNYQHEILKTWEDGTFREIGEAKLRLLSGITYDDLVRTAAEPYKLLLDEWIYPLILPFSQVNIGYTVLMTDLQFQHSRGKITTIEFEKRIEKIERERASIINYDEFIKVFKLDVPVNSSA